MKTFTVSAIIAAAINATPEDKANYPRWADALEYEGYTWEPYTTVTEDGWHLSLLRITGRTNDNSNVEKHSTPVLVTHGLGMSATSWIE